MKSVLKDNIINSIKTTSVDGTCQFNKLHEHSEWFGQGSTKYINADKMKI